MGVFALNGGGATLGGQTLIKMQTQEYANFTLHPRDVKRKKKKRKQQKGFIKKGHALFREQRARGMA